MPSGRCGPGAADTWRGRRAVRGAKACHAVVASGAGDEKPPGRGSWMSGSGDRPWTATYSRRWSTWPSASPRGSSRLGQPTSRRGRSGGRRRAAPGAAKRGSAPALPPRTSRPRGSPSAWAVPLTRAGYGRWPRRCTTASAWPGARSTACCAATAACGPSAPALGLSAPNRDYPVATHVRGFLAHLVWGAAAALAAEAIYHLTGTAPDRADQPAGPRRPARRAASA